MHSSLKFVALIAWITTTACGSDDTGSQVDQDAASNAGNVERGPKVLAIDGDPNGVWWDDGSQTLYVADDNGNRLLKWTDADGFSLVTDLPSASPEGAGLGQLVLTDDDTVVVTRFGYGTTGDVVYVPKTENPKIVSGLNAERRRIGLTVAHNGDLYDSWFVRLATGDRVGAVGKLSLSGTEAEVITGLKKPVGVLAVGDDLLVSDQDLGQILKAPLSDPSAYTVLAAVDKPDLLAEGPNGSIFTGSAGGSLYQITSTGAASVFHSGFQEVHGVAYDPTNHRVFVADHDPDESNGTTHSINILPVD